MAESKMRSTLEVLINSARKQGRDFYAAHTRDVSKRELLVYAVRTAQREFRTKVECLAFLAAITEALEEADRGSIHKGARQRTSRSARRQRKIGEPRWKRSTEQPHD
jgi:hypothetical protein